ncbi:MAG: hypothetical protein U9N30_02020 [Campylobacterota bacterium]|nr:hypothetical protein [Campylobacterota bacterium]
MNKQLELFESIFDNTPNLAILHLDNDLKMVQPIVKDLAQRNEGILSYYDFKDKGGCDKFPSKSRDYEYAVLSDVLQHCPYPDKMLKLIYRSLENSAFIIVLCDKKDIEVQEIIDLLDQCNFLAVNDIDLFEKYHLVVAKKMHMWDAGL